MSISIGVNFYTNVTRRHARVHQLNRVLRKWGLDPTPLVCSRCVSASRHRWALAWHGLARGSSIMQVRRWPPDAVLPDTSRLRCALAHWILRIGQGLA